MVSDSEDPVKKLFGNAVLNGQASTVKEKISYRSETIKTFYVEKTTSLFYIIGIQ